MAQEWRVREYQEADEETLRELYGLVFDESMSREKWDWLYHRNPCGDRVIIVAEANGKLVGQSTMLPLHMKVGNDQGVGTLTLNVMTHPNYQGRGIFTALARGAQQLAAEKRMVVTYAFANENSYPAFIRRLGWVDLGPTAPVYVRPLNTASLLRAKFGPLSSVMAPLAHAVYLLLARPVTKALPHGWTVTSALGFDPRWDAVWERVAPRLPIAVVRDRRYLQWRYVEHPVAKYDIIAAERHGELGGYCILRGVERFGLRLGFLMDLLVDTDHPEGADALLGRVLQIARERRYDALVCMMMPGSPWLSEVRKWGFMKVPRRLYPQALHLIARSLSPQYDQAFITDPRAWYITWGDHDSV